MPRHRLDPDDRKEPFTVRLPAKLIRTIRSVPLYNVKIEKLLKEHFQREIEEKED